MAKFDIVATFKIDGITDLKKSFKDIGDAAENVGKSFGKFKDAVGDSAKRIAAIGLAAVGAGTAVVAMAADFASAAEQIDNLSTKTGISSQKIEEVQEIAKGMGIPIESVGKSFVKLTKNLKDLRDPTSAAGKELTKLSPSIAQAVRSAPNATDAFDILKASLAGMTDETKVANIAQLAFGKSGLDLIPILTQGNKEYDDQAAKLKKFGLILSDVQTKSLAGLDNSFDDVGFAVEGLGKQITVILAPALTAGATAFSNFILQNRDKILQFVSVLTNNVFTTVKDFFKLMSDGPEAQGVSTTALKIYNAFIQIKGAVTDAFTIAKVAATALFLALDPIAKVLGLGSGANLGIALALLQVTGLLKVFTTGIGLATSSLNLMFQVVTGAPAIWKVFSSTLTGIVPLLVTGINTIRTTFLAAITAMEISGLSLAPILAGLAEGFTVLWLAVTGPIGIAIALIIAVGAAIYLLIDKTIGWKTVIDAVGAAFTTALNVAAQLLAALVVGLASFISTIGEVITGAFASVIGFLSGVFAQVSTILSGIITSVASTLSGIFTSIKTAITDVITYVATAAVNIFTTVVNTVKGIITSVIQSITSAITSFFQPVIDLFNSLQAKGAAILSGAKNASAPSVTNTPATKSAPKFGPGFAGGGPIAGPGTGTSDSIMARLSNGEFVVKARSVAKFGTSFFHALNNGVMPMIKGFADGGLVGLDNMAAAALGIGNSPFASAAGVSPGQSVVAGRALNLHLGNGQVVKARTDESTARKLERDLRRSDNAKSSALPGWYK